jgi:hypothetical protein
VTRQIRFVCLDKPGRRLPRRASRAAPCREHVGQAAAGDGPHPASAA